MLKEDTIPIKGGRALFLSAFLPSKDIPAAGNKLSADTLERLRQNYQQVDVVTFSNSLDDNFAQTWIANAPANVKIFKILLVNRLAAAILYPFLPAGAAVRYHLARKELSALLRIQHYHEVYVDFTQAAELLPPMLRNEATLRTHDVLSQLYARSIDSKGLKRYVYRVEFWKVRRWEKKILAQFGKVLSLNAKDAALIESWTGRSVEVEFPTGYYQVEGRSLATIKKGSILYWGNYTRPENVDAVRFFATEILPHIMQKFPLVKFKAAGASPPMVGQDKNIEWTGFIEDPSVLFREAELGVVPLRFGAGIKIKTLEFITSGIPTVATTVGSEGVPSSSLMHIKDDPIEFAQACISILEQS